MNPQPSERRDRKGFMPAMVRLVALLWLAAALGCKAASFDQGSGNAKDKGGSGGRPTDDDEAVPGYLLNVADATVVQGEGSTRVIAPAGALVLSGRVGFAAFWEITAASFQQLVYLDENRILIPGTRLVDVLPSADGAFDVVVPASSGLRVLAGNGTQAGFIVFKVEDVTAAELLADRFQTLSFAAVQEAGRSQLGDSVEVVEDTSTFQGTDTGTFSPTGTDAVNGTDTGTSTVIDPLGTGT